MSITQKFALLNEAKLKFTSFIIEKYSGQDQNFNVYDWRFTLRGETNPLIGEGKIETFQVTEFENSVGVDLKEKIEPLEIEFFISDKKEDFEVLAKFKDIARKYSIDQRDDFTNKYEEKIDEYLRGKYAKP